MARNNTVWKDGKRKREKGKMREELRENEKAPTTSSEQSVSRSPQLSTHSPTDRQRQLFYLPEPQWALCVLVLFLNRKGALVSCSSVQWPSGTERVCTSSAYFPFVFHFQPASLSFSAIIFCLSVLSSTQWNFDMRRCYTFPWYQFWTIWLSFTCFHLTTTSPTSKQHQPPPVNCTKCNASSLLIFLFLLVYLKCRFTLCDVLMRPVTVSGLLFSICIFCQLLCISN